MGRPSKPIDAALVGKLAAIQCTMNEIALVCDCSVDTLERRFADVIEKGRAEGRASLRRKQVEVAMGGGPGSATMLVWLGKIVLQQSEKVALEHSMAGAGSAASEMPDTVEGIYAQGGRLVSEFLGRLTDAESEGDAAAAEELSEIRALVFRPASETTRRKLEDAIERLVPANDRSAE